MNTQYILRVEHPESKTGPLTNSGQFSDKTFDALRPFWVWGRWNKHPPISRTKGFISDVHVCGVEYKSHFVEWFGPFWQLLHEAGFKLQMYLLPAAKVLKCESGVQVAFNKADALEVIELSML